MKNLLSWSTEDIERIAEDLDIELTEEQLLKAEERVIDALGKSDAISDMIVSAITVTVLTVAGKGTA